MADTVKVGQNIQYTDNRHSTQTTDTVHGQQTQHTDNRHSARTTDTVHGQRTHSQIDTLDNG